MNEWRDKFFTAADKAIAEIELAKFHYQKGAATFVVAANLAAVRRELREAQAVLHGRR